jgi:hypothetical protein
MRLFAKSTRGSQHDESKGRTDEFAIVNDGIVPGLTGVMYAASLGLITAKSSGIAENLGQVYGGVILGALAVSATALQLQSGNLKAIKNKGMSLTAAFLLTTGVIKDADAAHNVEQTHQTPAHINIKAPNPHLPSALTHP